MPDVALSSPWEIYRKKILYTFGLSDSFTVKEFEQVSEGYNLNIIGSHDLEAKALREVLPLVETFGGVKVFIKIMDINGNTLAKSNQFFTTEILANTLHTLLNSNDLYLGIKLTSSESKELLGDLVVLIDKQVVQFFNDTLDDLCNNYNEVASKVFYEVSTKTFTGNLRISYSTFDKNCIAGKDLYRKKNTSVEEKVTISEPWYSFRNKILYTFGLSPSIYVNELESTIGGYNLKITVTDNTIAMALRELLPLEKSFGQIKVFIKIVNSSGSDILMSNQLFTASTLANTFCTVLCNNPLFKGVVLSDGTTQKSKADVIVILNPKIVQFPNAEISNICFNFNGIASDVFDDICKKTFTGNLKVAFTTYYKQCLISGKAVCVKNQNITCNCNCCNRC